MEEIFQAALGLGVIAAGLFTGWQSWQARKRADRAADAAKTAEIQTRATGNGFAGDVLGRLQRIEDDGKATHVLAKDAHELMVEHLKAHADSDLRRKA